MGDRVLILAPESDATRADSWAAHRHCAAGQMPGSKGFGLMNSQVQLLLLPGPRSRSGAPGVHLAGGRRKVPLPGSDRTTAASGPAFPSHVARDRLITTLAARPGPGRANICPSYVKEPAGSSPPLARGEGPADAALDA
ncbi:hypothetical protein JCM4814A_94760 [Streptomyces phaeofaciens JCM 4814]|uniref:Uncharacterized protein n=1 Tax=Streptomyces phaeofaciens TaxID=68254 RepID=A0A918HR31_9ACTN|nr:hypothetical protein GCM10010226_88500 [Streptomyces phaeofaciens]